MKNYNFAVYELIEGTWLKVSPSFSRRGDAVNYMDLLEDIKILQVEIVEYMK
jgi:hypothetical protein